MNVLITGENSYVGRNFKSWLIQWPSEYIVQSISVKNDHWKSHDFSKYDVILHAAAIVHKKELPKYEENYYAINRDLTIEIATKAKLSGVKHFIFMSSMSVYGLEGTLKNDIIVGKNTSCNPNTYYGKSKLEAEFELNKLCGPEFIVSIVRPPMIYGPECPGNFSRLKKLILRMPVFPLYHNKRSMIYIDCLSAFLKELVDDARSGIFHPQNENYVDIYDLVRIIGEVSDKRIWFSSFLTKIIISFKSAAIVKKVFGSLVYDMEISTISSSYSKEFYKTIQESVKG